MCNVHTARNTEYASSLSLHPTLQYLSWTARQWCLYHRNQAGCGGSLAVLQPPARHSAEEHSAHRYLQETLHPPRLCRTEAEELRGTRSKYRTTGGCLTCTIYLYKQQRDEAYSLSLSISSVR